MKRKTKKLALLSALALGLLGLLSVSVLQQSDHRQRGRGSIGSQLGGAATVPSHQANREGVAQSTDSFEALDRDRDVHGIVLSPEDRPVAGARVSSVRYRDRRPTLAVTWPAATAERVGDETRTDSSGRFRIRIPSGSVVAVRVVAEGYPVHEQPGIQAGEFVAIVLRAGTRAQIRVVDSSAAPVAGAKVKAWEDRGDAGVGYYASVETTIAGIADLGVVAVGMQLRVLVVGPDSLVGPSEPRRPIRVTRGTPFTHLVTIASGRDLRISVVDSVSGSGIPHALVHLGWARRHTWETDSAGRLVLKGWAGRHRLGVSADGYASDQVTPRKQDELRIRLVSGARVTGAVVDRRGRGIAKARIDIAGFRGPRLVGRHATQADADGKFAVDCVAPGIVHTLVVRANGYARTLADFMVPSTDSGPFELGGIVVHDPRAIRGRVVDSDGDPVARFPLNLLGANADRRRLLPDDSPASARLYGAHEARRTDDLGRFAFVGIPSGNYRIQCWDPSRAKIDIAVEVPADGDAPPVTIRVPAAKKLRAVAVTTRGVHLSGVGMVAKTSNDAYIAYSNRDGVATFLLPRGEELHSVRVFGRHPGWIDLNGQLFMTPAPRTGGLDGEDGAVTFELSPAGTARGIVLSDALEPHPGAVVHVERAGMVLSQCRSKSDGSFEAVLPIGEEVDLRALEAQEAGRPRGPRLERGVLSPRISAGREGVRLVLPSAR